MKRSGFEILGSQTAVGIAHHGGVADTVPGQAVELARIGHHVVVLVGTLADAPRTLELHGHAVALSGLGGHHHHAVGRTRTVERVRHGVFRHGDRLDVGGIDVGEFAVERHAVDDDQRAVAGRKRTDTADDDRRILTGLARAVDNLQTGHGALQRIGDGRCLRVLDDVGLYTADRTNEVLLALGTERYDRHFVDRLRIFVEHDVDSGLSGYGDRCGFIAQERYEERSVGGGCEREAAVGARGGTGARAFHDHRGARYRCAVRPAYLARDGPVLCRRTQQARAQYRN